MVSICISKRKIPIRPFHMSLIPPWQGKRTNRPFSRTQGNKSRKIKFNIWPRKEFIDSVESCCSSEHNEVPRGANGWVLGEIRVKEWVICITSGTRGLQKSADARLCIICKTKAFWKRKKMVYCWGSMDGSLKSVGHKFTFPHFHLIPPYNRRQTYLIPTNYSNLILGYYLKR